MGEYKPKPGDISIYKYQSHIVGTTAEIPLSFTEVEGVAHREEG
jgi:hypothetical protein